MKRYTKAEREAARERKYPCDFNSFVDCSPDGQCGRCGWNPAIREKRVKQIRARLAAGAVVRKVRTEPMRYVPDQQIDPPPGWMDADYATEPPEEEPDPERCPVCARECYMVVYNNHTEKIVGCNWCLVDMEWDDEAGEWK